MMTQGSKDQTLDLGLFFIHSYDIHICFTVCTYCISRWSSPSNSKFGFPFSFSLKAPECALCLLLPSWCLLSLSDSLSCLHFAFQCCQLHPPVIVLLCTCISSCFHCFLPQFSAFYCNLMLLFQD